MRSSFPRTALTSLIVAVAMLCGPLALTPAHAATSTVSGVVKDAAGRVVEDAEISVWVKDDEQQAYFELDEDVFTDAQGRYSLDLEPGTYKLRIDGDRVHVPEYYNDAATLRLATPVIVNGSPQSLDDTELALRPAVRGTVTSETGGVVPDVYVVAFRYYAGYGWDEVDGAGVEADGTYVLPLDAGTYRIGFFDEEDEHIAEYWKDAPTVAQASDVTIGAADITGVDARLAEAPRPTVVNHTPPSVAGFAAVGQVVQANDGMWFTNPTWIQAAVTTSRQWLRNGVPVPGAVGPTYRVTQADLGATLATRVTGSIPGIRSQTLDSASSGIVKWNSKIQSTSRPGKKKATLTIRAVSYGGVPTGTVTIKLRQKVIKTVRLRNGRAVVTLKKLRKSQKYDFFYSGDARVHASRGPQWVKIKK